MGNTIQKIPCCCCLKKSEEKKGAGERQPEGKLDAVAAPTYDTVADFPVYAVVNKNRPPNPVQEESVQYAEIQVIQKKPKSKMDPPRRPQDQETTEYATLNFPKPYDSTNGTLV